MRTIINMIAGTLIIAVLVVAASIFDLQQLICDALLWISGLLAMVAVTVSVTRLARKALSSSISP
jgi:hypothetical protein